MRRIRSGCCAALRASGHAAAVPPRSVMNSRRRISAPNAQGPAIVAASDEYLIGLKPGVKPLPECTRLCPVGSCVTRIAGPNGDAQLYER